MTNIKFKNIKPRAISAAEWTYLPLAPASDSLGFTVAAKGSGSGFYQGSAAKAD